MTTLLILAATTISTLYQNDFATRTSADLAPGAAWATYEYGKGVALAYNYDDTGTQNRSTKPYEWQPAQDGWTKVVYASGRLVNNGATTVSNEDDPAFTFSDKDVTIGGVETFAKDHLITVAHPLRNVFTNGVLRYQFDILQPQNPTSAQFSWFRLVEEYDMDVGHASNSEFPLEIGIASKSLSGGWKDNPDAEDGHRDYHTFGGVTSGHWYRFYVTSDIDGNVSEFEVYDLGTSRIGMDAKPSWAPCATQKNCYFRRKVNGDLSGKGTLSGGISGIMIRVAYLDTKGYYGEAGYDESLSYKYDNIKVAWKAPGKSDFVECYRNDFSKSKRRSIDGRAELSHDYVLSDLTDSMEFTYKPEWVRDCTKYDYSFPYMTSYRSSLANKPQYVCVDGWRVAGNSSYSAPVVVTTNGSNQVLAIYNFGMNKQPMCPEVTSGIVKFEFDQRMPKGWNGTARCEVDLFSDAAYENGINCQDDAVLRYGLSAATWVSGSDAALLKTFGLLINGSKYVAGTTSLKALTWYRLQAVINLDTKRATLYAYEIGPNAPLKPDDFDASDTSKAVYTETVTLRSPSGYASGISAWGLTNYLVARNSSEGNDAADLVMYLDNVRFWKQDGDKWTLLFQNDFSKTQRKEFVNKALPLNPKGQIDRPEYGEDGWNACPTYNSPVYVTGKDSALQVREWFVSLAHPLGRTIRKGMLTAQFDVRLPVVWSHDKMYFALGGGALASASTATTPSRFNTHTGILVGFMNGCTSYPSYDMSIGNTGLPTTSRIWSESGPGCSVWYNTLPAESGDYELARHWIRAKITSDVATGKFNVDFYDLGTAHPTFDTPEGTAIKSWKGIEYRFKDPISHLWINAGQTPSYQPWKDDAPGAMLIDNIRVCHDKQGIYLSVR